MDVHGSECCASVEDIGSHLREVGPQCDALEACAAREGNFAQRFDFVVQVDACQIVASIESPVSDGGDVCSQFHLFEVCAFIEAVAGDACDGVSCSAIGYSCGNGYRSTVLCVSCSYTDSCSINFVIDSIVFEVIVGGSQSDVCQQDCQQDECFL